ncbi:MAG: hypothetical protein M3552_18830 [Planctomycetota bacterium]|nr:hypothetical protein [Planctomycetota bacterium]
MSIDGTRRGYYVVGGLLAAALAIGVFFWAIRLDRPPAGGTEEILQQQANRRAAWLADSPVPVSASERWDAVIGHFPSEGCLVIPHGAQFVVASEVPASQRDDLAESVAELFRAYAADSPDAVLQFMSEHGEILRSDRVAVLRKLLAGVRKVPEARLSSVTGEEAYRAFWKEAKLRSHWSGILEDSGCVQYWRYDGAIGPELAKSFGQVDSEIFQNVTNFVHEFRSTRSLEDVISSNQSVLFGDVKIVVLLEPEFYSEPLPYFLRFWYDPEGQVWHPYQMGRVEPSGSTPPSDQMF